MGVFVLGAGALAFAASLDDYAIVTNKYAVASSITIGEDGPTADPDRLNTAGDLRWDINGIGLGDFDNDGLADYVMGGQANSTRQAAIEFHKKLGPATFADGIDTGAVVSGKRIMDFAVADYNADGNLDFAVSEYDSAVVSVHLGNGDGTFVTGDSYPLKFRVAGMDAEDINGDGRADFVAPRYENAGSTADTREMAVFLGNGDGSFGSDDAPFETLVLNAEAKNKGSVWGVALSDFNSDGKVDVVMTNWHYAGVSSRVSFYAGDGEGSFDSAPVPSGLAGTDNSALDNADFDGDGFQDLIASNSDSSVTVLFGKGDGRFDDSDFGDVSMGLPGNTYAVSTLPFLAEEPPPECEPDACGCGPDADADNDGVLDCAETEMTLTAGESHVRFHPTRPERGFALFTGSMDLPGGLLAPDFRDGSGDAAGMVSVTFGDIDAIGAYENRDIAFGVTDFCHQSNADNREKWQFNGGAREKVTLRWKNSQKYRSDNDVELPGIKELGNLGLIVSRFVSTEEVRLRFRWNNKTDLPFTVAIDGVPVLTVVDNGDKTYTTTSSYEVFDVYQRDGTTERKRVKDVLFPGRLGNGEEIAWYADDDPTDGLDNPMHSHEAIDDGTATAVFYNAGGRFRVKVPLAQALANGLTVDAAEKQATVSIQAGTADTPYIVEGQTVFDGYTVDGNHWRLKEVDEDGTPTEASTHKTLARCATCGRDPVETLNAGEMAGFTFQTKKADTVVDASFLLRSDTNHSGTLRAYLCQLDTYGNPTIELETTTADVSLDYRERVRFTFSGATVLEPGEQYAVVLKNESGQPLHILGGDHCGAGQRILGLFTPHCGGSGWGTDVHTLPAVNVRGLR